MFQEGRSNSAIASTRHRIAFLLGAISLLGGCTSTAPLTQPKDVRSLVAFTKQLRADTSAGLDPILGAALRESTRAVDPIAKQRDPRVLTRLSVTNHQEVESPAYSAIATWWCPRHQQINSARTVSDQYGAVCNVRGGQWMAPQCIQPATSKIIFLALIKTPSLCSGNSPTVAVTVIEPKGALDAPDYLSAVQIEMYLRFLQ